MNNHFEIDNSETKAAFLAGDSILIKDLGQMYLKSMGKEPIPTSEISSFLQGSPAYLQPVGEGWGMSTDDAIRCLFDTERTSRFVRSIKKSVTLIKERFGQHELTAVEAGCGTGILAVAMALAGIDHVTALDINPVTVKHTQRFIEGLGLANKIETIKADATRFIPDNTFHLLVSENMHTGLYFEPQQQIIGHFYKFLKDGGIVLPQSISMRYGLAELDWKGLGKNHAEFKKVLPYVQHMVRSWSGWETILFQGKEPFDGKIEGIVPVDEFSTNALVTQMNVHIWSDVILPSSTAQFLGQPHVVQVELLECKNPEVKYGKFLYQAGGEPPRKVRLIP